MAVQRKVRKLHEFFEEEAMRTCRLRKAVGLVRALEDFAQAHKQRVQQELAQRTLERLRVVKKDVERRRAARLPSSRATPRRAHAPHALPEATAETTGEKAGDTEAEDEKAEGEKAEGDEEKTNCHSSTTSLSCLSDDSGNIWCPPRHASFEPTVLPGNFRPLEDLSRDDLAHIYSTESYVERRRLFKEACRKRFGRHVWTWEHLTGFEPRSLSDTCPVPPVADEERQRLNRKHVSPTKLQGLVRQVRKDLEDEEKELELKFLELEMKMNPHVAQEGLYDYQPEVITELRDAVCARQRTPRMNVTTKRWKRVWNSVPKATMNRVRHRARNAVSSSDDSDTERQRKRLKNVLLYDSKNKCFLPPQAMLRRAKVHERLAEERRLMEELEIERKASTQCRTSPIRCTKPVVMIELGNTKPCRKIRSGGGDVTNKTTGKKKPAGLKKNIQKTANVATKSGKELPCHNLDSDVVLNVLDEAQNSMGTHCSRRCPSVEVGENRDFNDTTTFTQNDWKSNYSLQVSCSPFELTECRNSSSSSTKSRASELLRTSPTTSLVNPSSRNTGTPTSSSSSMRELATLPLPSADSGLVCRLSGSIETHTPSRSARKDFLQITSRTLDLICPTSKMVKSIEVRTPLSSSDERDTVEDLGTTSSTVVCPLSVVSESTEMPASSPYNKESTQGLPIATANSDLVGPPSGLTQSTEMPTSSRSCREESTGFNKLSSPSSVLDRPPSKITESTGTLTSCSCRENPSEVHRIASLISAFAAPPLETTQCTKTPASSSLSKEEDPVVYSTSSTSNLVCPASNITESMKSTPSCSQKNDYTEILGNTPSTSTFGLNCPPSRVIGSTEKSTPSRYPANNNSAVVFQTTSPISCSVHSTLKKETNEHLSTSLAKKEPSKILRNISAPFDLIRSSSFIRLTETPTPSIYTPTKELSKVLHNTPSSNSDLVCPSSKTIQQNKTCTSTSFMKEPTEDHRNTSIASCLLRRVRRSQKLK